MEVLLNAQTCNFLIEKKERKWPIILYFCIVFFSSLWHCFEKKEEEISCPVEQLHTCKLSCHNCKPCSSINCCEDQGFCLYGNFKAELIRQYQYIYYYSMGKAIVNCLRV